MMLLMCLKMNAIYMKKLNIKSCYVFKPYNLQYFMPTYFESLPNFDEGEPKQVLYNFYFNNTFSPCSKVFFVQWNLQYNLEKGYVDL